MTITWWWWCDRSIFFLGSIWGNPRGSLHPFAEIAHVIWYLPGRWWSLSVVKGMMVPKMKPNLDWLLIWASVYFNSKVDAKVPVHLATYSSYLPTQPGKKTPVPLPAIESKVLTAWVSLADGQSIAVWVEVHTLHTLERWGMREHLATTTWIFCIKILVCRSIQRYSFHFKQTMGKKLFPWGELQQQTMLWDVPATCCRQRKTKEAKQTRIPFKGKWRRCRENGQSNCMWGLINQSIASWNKPQRDQPKV